jgi:hypothetical protein
MEVELRVTTDAEFFEEHSDSLELWSPGSPLFPDPGALGADDSNTAPQLQSRDEIEQALSIRQ